MPARRREEHETWVPAPALLGEARRGDSLGLSFPPGERCHGPLHHLLCQGFAFHALQESLPGLCLAPYSLPCRGAGGRASAEMADGGGRSYPLGAQPGETVRTARGKRQKNTYKAAYLQINGVQTKIAPSAEGMRPWGDKLLCGAAASLLCLCPPLLLTERRSLGFLPAERGGTEPSMARCPCLQDRKGKSPVGDRGASTPSPEPWGSTEGAPPSSTRAAPSVGLRAPTPALPS